MVWRISIMNQRTKLWKASLHSSGQMVSCFCLSNSNPLFDFVLQSNMRCHQVLHWRNVFSFLFGQTLIFTVWVSANASEKVPSEQFGRIENWPLEWLRFLKHRLRSQSQKRSALIHVVLLSLIKISVGPCWENNQTDWICSKMYSEELHLYPIENVFYSNHMDGEWLFNLYLCIFHLSTSV